MPIHYKSILVAVDGSKEAEYAFKKAIHVAKRNVGARLNIVHILDSRLETIDRTAMERVEQEASELLNQYKAQAKADGIESVDTFIKFGSPKVAITGDIAKLVQADLILCGATGRHGVERFLVGSVSEAIVRTAKCDVLVIRTQD